MKKIFFLTLLCIIPSLLFSQKDVTVPETSAFDTGVGDQSSVNQSNGKLGIGLNLISLQGFKDLNTTIGIAYDGNNVPRNAKSSNKFAPTGVLGLGWGVSFSRIMCDNKLTTTREDDSFYLLEGGSLTELICIAKTSSRYDFKLKAHKPWKVYFYPNQERWEVIKDNGYISKYENVDWSIYWDNWIGNSNQSGGNRQGSSWNITSVEDLHGNSMSYEYINIEQSLKNTGAIKHTEATYLSKIIGPLGEEIRLIYSNKVSDEYYEPNTNEAEPDAYQEVYEKKFLRRIEAYDSHGDYLYQYYMAYSLMGSGEHRKRILKKITLINSEGDQQIFREFQYNQNSNSDFYGALIHQILPTKGRVSYQYESKEVLVDQIYETTAYSDNTTYIVQQDYILKLDGLNDLYLITWDGITWSEQLVSNSIPSGGVSGDYKSIPIIARKDYFLVLHGGNPDRVILGGLEENGKTWKISTTGSFDDVGAGLLSVQLMAGEDFFAIGNPDANRINFYRWDGKNWKTELVQTSATGKYFYTATNNYLIRNRRKSGEDSVRLYYFDALGDLKSKNFNTGFSTAGGVCDNAPENCPGNGWYAQNSFAQVNANGNPEYFIRWDKNYNFLSTDASGFGEITDFAATYPIYNNYNLSVDWNSNAGIWGSKFARYLGNGQWVNSDSNVPEYSDDYRLQRFGFGQDAMINPITHVGPPNLHFKNEINYFNANTAQWQKHTSPNYNVTAYETASYEVFGGNYLYGHNQLYRLNPNLSISTLNNYPDNTILAKSDGQNIMYLSSRNGDVTSGSPYSKLLTLTKENQIQEFDLPAGYFLWKNKYKNYPTHAIGYGTFIVKDESSNNIKIYKVIDGKLEVNGSTQTIVKDYVVVKETFDPVLTRKKRNYYCYGEPAMAKDNIRVYYCSVAQLSDVDAVLGRTLTNYDTGDTDERRIGLPLKVRVYDANDNLISEQDNTWTVNDLDWEQEYGPGNTFYINLKEKVNRSFEGTRQITSQQNFQYDMATGYIKSTSLTDSEGNIETSENIYLFEEFPQAENDNLLNPVIYTRTSTDDGINGPTTTQATAVNWDLSGIPIPDDSYGWNGKGGTSGSAYNFTGSNPNFRYAQTIEMVDNLGNILQEKNRSEVVTSYVYGYGSKRLVAKIEGGSYNSAIALVNNSILNNPSSDTQLRAELQKIRDGMPDAFVTSYTYKPAIGVTSVTGPRGRTQHYYYDNFYRLDYIKNHDGKILKKNQYQYRSEPFVYESESTALPDCTLATMGIGQDQNPDPVAISLFKFSESQYEVVYKVLASDGGTYNYSWTYYTDPPNSNLEYIENGAFLTVRNDQCLPDVVVSAQATATINSNQTVTGYLSHTMNNNECF